jgi:hypothetical protein
MADTPQQTFPRIPGPLGVIFRFIRAARNELRSQPPPFAAKSSGCSPREAATRCFAVTKAHLCRRHLSHLTHVAVTLAPGGARSRAISVKIFLNICRDTSTSAIWNVT